MPGVQVFTSRFFLQFLARFIKLDACIFAWFAGVLEGVDLAQEFLPLSIMHTDVRARGAHFNFPCIGENKIVFTVNINFQLAAVAFPVIVPAGVYVTSLD